MILASGWPAGLSRIPVRRSFMDFGFVSLASPVVMNALQSRRASLLLSRQESARTSSGRMSLHPTRKQHSRPVIGERRPPRRSARSIRSGARARCSGATIPTSRVFSPAWMRAPRLGRPRPIRGRRRSRGRCSSGRLRLGVARLRPDCGRQPHASPRRGARNTIRPNGYRVAMGQPFQGAFAGGSACQRKLPWHAR